MGSVKYPYRTAAQVYREKGWINVIPIGYNKPGVKTPPVKGYTGRDALTVDSGQVETWRNDMPQSNIALRMDAMVALDVDGVEGLEVLDAVQRELECPLPDTFSSTAHGVNSPRRHFFYRIPPTLDLSRLEGVLRKLHGEKLDVVHRGHRYAIVAPSLHPDGGTYAWYDQNDQPCEVPAPQDIPFLPPAWCEYFSRLREKGPRESAPAAVMVGADLFDPAPAFAGGEHRMTEGQVWEAWRRAILRFRDAFTEGNRNNAIRDLAFYAWHVSSIIGVEDVAEVVLGGGQERYGWTELDGEDIGTIERAWQDAQAQGQWVAEIVSEAEAQEVEAADARLQITGAADMAYWLAEHAGRGRMSGFFSRAGLMVHTPRVSEMGYVPAPAGADNGPVEIRPVTGPVLAAKLQYLYECFKIVDEKDESGKKTGEKREVPALFPKQAAQVAVDAPEALAGLRPLRGVTGTPMVRVDGSLLADPGYDDASGFLFLPEPGVEVPPVPGNPDAADLLEARGWLMDMVQDFPFATDDDRANYLGLLLTPLLRQVAPPSYKMFGIGAHQPGSGKSLLAEVAGLIHGSVLRSDVPEDEAEWRKQTFSILATTAAPLVVLDNVMGVLKSSVLAGVLTAGRDLTDRELGSSSTITVANDRVWVVTGNNLSIGGDLVRRTVTILIDPDTPNPEKRVDFAIPDLKGWVAENRNRILWSLLVLIRGWVAAGMPEPERKQSDSFARWERVVAGVLEVAGVPGVFDADSGKRAAAGGDDDGLVRALDALHDRFGDQSWSVAEALRAQPAPDAMIREDRDAQEWIPGPVVDKLARSEQAGRISLGWWLRHRIGRWVTDADGRSLVLREAPMEKKVARWKVEVRG